MKYIKALGVLILLCTASLFGQTGTVSMTGQVNSPQGTTFNGYLSIRLPRANVRNTCATPSVLIPTLTITYPIVNGVPVGLSSGNFVSQDCMSVRVPYYVEIDDTNHMMLSGDNWYLPLTAGGTVNIGLMQEQHFTGPINVAIPQGIISTPAASQVITQPGGTSLTINGTVNLTGQVNLSLPSLPVANIGYLNKVEYIDPASASDLVTQANALFSNCGNNCEVHIPPHDTSEGCYTVSSGTISMTHAGQSLIGDGMHKVCINYAGTNFLDARLNSGTYASGTGAVSGFTLTCSNTAAKCMSGGSWPGFQFGINHDLEIIGPGGLFGDNPIGTSQCLDMQNTAFWHERSSFDFDFEGCQIGIHFEAPTGGGTLSFEYNQLNITSTLNLGSTGIKIETGVQLEHFRSLHYQFNVGGNGSGAIPVIFDIGDGAVFSGGDGVIVGESGSQPYTLAHVRGTGFAAVSGSIFTFNSPQFVFDTSAGGWCWGSGCDAGSLFQTANNPTLTGFPLASNTDVYDIHYDHRGDGTANSAYLIGFLRDLTGVGDTPYRSGASNQPICDMTHNAFGSLNALTVRDCIDGSGNFWPVGAYQLVGPNGPTATGSTKSAVVGDGDIILAAGSQLTGRYVVTFAGPNRLQAITLEVGTANFDTLSSLKIIKNYAYVGQTVLTNFRIVLLSNAPQLVATIGNRNAGTQLTVTSYGDAVFTDSLLPSATVGSTATVNTAYQNNFNVLTDAATITWSSNGLDNNYAKVTLGGNRTLNISGFAVGGKFELEIIQDGTGSRTLTLGTGCTWKVANGGAGSIISSMSTAANALDKMTGIYDGTNCLVSVIKNYN